MKKASPREPTAEERRLERKEKRHERRRQLIMDATKSLLASRGLEHFTIAAVASVAGVSKSAVYYYFDSKEQLVAGLAIRSLAREVESLTTAVEAAPGGIEALAGVIRAYVDHYVADLDGFRVLYVWPQLLGVDEQIVDSDVYPSSRALDDRLEAMLVNDRADGLLAPGASPRALANLARITAHGLVAFAAGLGSAVGAPRHPVADLRDAAARAIVRAASA